MRSALLVALLNEKDLIKTSTSFEGETLSRLKVIKALYYDLTEDNKKRLDSDPCLNGKSVNLFIKEQLKKNNIKELLNLVDDKPLLSEISDEDASVPNLAGSAAAEESSSFCVLQ